VVSLAEKSLALILQAEKIDFIQEYRFCAQYVGLGKGVKERLKQARLKDWRFDFAFLNAMLAVEVEGGGWVGGRHTTGRGFAEDLRKYNAAALLNWFVLRCDFAMIKDGSILQTIKAQLKIRQNLGR